MLAARGEHQQGLGLHMHGLMQQQFAQALGQRRAAGLASALDVDRARAQQLGDGLDLRALARAVDAFEADEAPAHDRIQPSLPRMWMFTARLCSRSVRENLLVPSPRATKYR